MPPQHRLRFAGYSPPDSLYSQAARRFKERVEAQSEGRVEVELLWNVLDQGYRAEQLIQMVASGSLGGMYMSTAYLVQQAPSLGLFDLPFLIEARSQAYRLMDGEIGQSVARELEQRTNFKHLGYWENGFRHISNRLHEVRSPEDLEGLRIRVQPNALHERAFELLGARPIRTDVADLIPAFRNGLIDGQENPLENIWLYSVYRETPFLTLTAHLYGVRGMYLYRPWFDALDEGLQAVVEVAAADATKFQRRLAVERDREMRQRLKAAGIEIVELSESEREAFRARVVPLYTEAAETLGQERLAQVSAAMKRDALD